MSDVVEVEITEFRVYHNHVYVGIHVYDNVTWSWFRVCLSQRSSQGLKLRPLSSSNNLTAICSEPKPNVESKTTIMYHNYTIASAYMIMSCSLGFGYAHLTTHLGDWKQGTPYIVLIQQSYRYDETYVYIQKQY